MNWNPLLPLWIGVVLIWQVGFGCEPGCEMQGMRLVAAMEAAGKTKPPTTAPRTTKVLRMVKVGLKMRAIIDYPLCSEDFAGPGRTKMTPGNDTQPPPEKYRGPANRVKLEPPFGGSDAVALAARTPSLWRPGRRRSGGPDAVALAAGGATPAQ